jgi:hypothetical protein
MEMTAYNQKYKTGTRSFFFKHKPFLFILNIKKIEQSIVGIFFLRAFVLPFWFYVGDGVSFCKP